MQRRMRHERYAFPAFNKSNGSAVPLLLTVTESVGWLVFIYLGAAGVYELIGGRRVRASALLGGAVAWIAVTVVVMWLVRPGGVLVVLLLLYFGATAWLVHKVFRLLGKPDMDVR